MKNFFDFKSLRGDIFGGLTAGIVALPLALAFGVSSGLGPMAGLYGAIFIGFFAALLGGTNTQISGPTAPMTAVSMLVIAGIVAANNGDVSRALPAILAVFLLAGLIQIGLGVLGLGKYIRYIPYPVVSGFMTAIGVIIILTQLLPAVGYYPKEDEAFVEQFKQEAEEMIIINMVEDQAQEDLLALESFDETVEKAQITSEEEILQESQTLAGKEASGVIGALRLMPRAVQNISLVELLLALGTIVIIYGFKRITKVVPSTLVALILMSGIADLTGIDYRTIERIPGGFPMPNFTIFSSLNISDLAPYIFSAITLAILGAIDSLLTSVVADNMTRTKHNPNRELVGQGIGNSVAALFGGIPGAGATIRTVVNINAGGKTRLSGMIAAILLLLTLLLLGPVASRIPAAVLAGILITVGIAVMDFKGLRAIPNMPRTEVAIMLVVLVLSSLWNLVYAVGIGLVIASLLFIKKIGDLAAESSDVKTLKETPWPDEVDFPEELKGEVFVKHVDGPLFFGSTSNFEQLSKQIPESASAVVIRMSKVPYMDQSGLYVMEDLLIDLANQGKTVIMTGLQKQPRYMMERVDMIPNLIAKDQLSEGFVDCVISLKENMAKEKEITMA
jgi:SulP family sulfate permease